MYAREKVRPKLFELDQEKLSRLFADLRRESMATNSYPITVRHLESMIRMAEASAKMALREYVRADDIDVAISVAVGSFVSTQKMSIKKTLERVSAPQDGRGNHRIYLPLFLTGLPQIPHTGEGSRRTTCIPPGTDCQRKGAIVSTTAIRATRTRLH
jgi:hypothetical protein